VVLTFKVEDIELLGAAQCLEKAYELERRGQYRDALKFALAAVEKDPKLEAAWMQLGQLQVRMGLSAFEEALRLDPANENLRRWLERQKGR
jgi:tetratricopeptide (TPR) repeat protein